MLSRIKKIPAGLGLLAISLLVLAGLDVLFVVAYEKPDIHPTKAFKPFVVAVTEEPKDEGEAAGEEEIAENVRPASTEFTPVDLGIPLQTKVKLEPFAARDDGENGAADLAEADLAVAGGQKTSVKKVKYAKRRICAKEALTMAVNVRSIQSKLMVAALSCPGARPRYNRFALKYSRPLKRNADVIMNYFKCSVGRKAVLQFDKTITRIANAAAALNSKKHEDFCDDVAGIFDELEEAESKDLVNVAKRHFYLDDDFWQE